MWALHAGFLAEEVVPTVPAAVLAEAWRGGSRQAVLARFLALCVIEDLTEQQARDVGVLVGKSGHDDVVDVAVDPYSAQEPGRCACSTRRWREAYAPGEGRLFDPPSRTPSVLVRRALAR
jgi:hypothetical protein